MHVFQTNGIPSSRRTQDQIWSLLVPIILGSVIGLPGLPFKVIVFEDRIYPFLGDK